MNGTLSVKIDASLTLGDNAVLSGADASLTTISGKLHIASNVQLVIGKKSKLLVSAGSLCYLLSPYNVSSFTDVTWDKNKLTRFLTCFAS